MVLLLHGTHIGNGNDRSIVIFAPAGTILSSCPILSNNIWIFPSHLLTGEIFPTVQLPLPPDIQFHPLPPNFIDLVYLGTVPTTPAACATFAASELLATSTTPTAITPAASSATSAVSSATSALSATSPTVHSASS
jgi:hypothetical protein